MSDLRIANQPSDITARTAETSRGLTELLQEEEAIRFSGSWELAREPNEHVSHTITEREGDFFVQARKVRGAYDIDILGRLDSQRVGLTTITGMQKPEYESGLDRVRFRGEEHSVYLTVHRVQEQ